MISIKFILVRIEQGAAFMAEIYGRLTGKAGVCVATLGSGDRLLTDAEMPTFGQAVEYSARSVICSA